jgi:predicted membrane-bound spermidine synthase
MELPSPPSRSSTAPGFNWALLYLAVALTTLGTLLLELSLTRIFSVVFYYHMAFLAISIALFGMGAGGVFSYVVAGWRGNLFCKIGTLSAVNTLLVFIAVCTILAQKESPGYTQFALIYFTNALPFFITGAILSLVISDTVEKINRVYFFDLLGAAGGCLLLIPLLNQAGKAGGPNTTLSVAVLFAAAAAIWFNLGNSRTGRVVSVGIALAFTLLVIVNTKTGWIDVRYAKGQKLENEKFVRWNSFSRIALGEERESHTPMIFIDADASTGIAQFDFDHLSDADRHRLLYEGQGLPYVIRPGAKTLIIGPGGGWDVSRALASGSRDVTGVEINPIIASTIMREKYPQLSHYLYTRRPEVHIVVEDGRSFARRTEQHFQVIQATLVDTWASTAAGAFALSENNLYTSDAFRDYLSHLTDDGLLVFTRWGFDPPRESLRLVSLAMVALQQLGESDPKSHVIVARAGGKEALEGWGALDTVIFSRKPFSAEDVERARNAIAEARLTPIYLPGPGPKNHFRDLLVAPDPVAWERDYIYDVSPVDDNRPFFFYTVQPRDLWGFLSTASQKTADFKVNKAVPLLFESLFVSIAAVLIILLLPPVVLRAKLPRENSTRAFLLYFFFIGAGFILIEVALIQKLVLFLGQPVYALTCVIFTLLLSSGVGSFFSRRLISGDDGRLKIALAAIAAFVALLAVSVGSILTAGVGLPLFVKVITTVVMIAPAGFLMGMPFPTGLARLEKRNSAAVRWAWSLNAASSVLGSVGALVCAIYMGLMQTLLVGGLLYLGALAVLAMDRAGASVLVSTGHQTRGAV